MTQAEEARIREFRDQPVLDCDAVDSVQPTSYP